jgi:hypothetical protein
MNQGRLPRNNEELKAHIRSQGGQSVDELFISERDNQPYVILYGKDAANPALGGLIAYEQLGVDGSRYIAYRSGSVEAIDEARFRELVPNAP